MLQQNKPGFFLKWFVSVDLSGYELMEPLTFTNSFVVGEKMLLVHNFHTRREKIKSN